MKSRYSILRWIEIRSTVIIAEGIKFIWRKSLMYNTYNFNQNWQEIIFVHHRVCDTTFQHYSLIYKFHFYQKEYFQNSIKITLLGLSSIFSLKAFKKRPKTITVSIALPIQRKQHRWIITLRAEIRTKGISIIFASIRISS